MKLLMLTVMFLFLCLVESAVFAEDEIEFQETDEIEYQEADESDLDLKQPPNKYFKDHLMKYLPSTDKQANVMEQIKQDTVEDHLNEALKQYLHDERTAEGEADDREEVKFEKFNLDEYKVKIEQSDEDKNQIEQSEVSEFETEQSVENEFQIEQSEEAVAEIEDFEVDEQRAGAVRHGSTIALRTFDSSQWLGCFNNPCRRAGCPRMLFTPQDYTRCAGEVFRIYRAAGSGTVKSGDLVGIYYPREQNWLGCAGRHCGKAGCPGQPDMRHGFADRHKWYQCWGEVFEIYKRGATRNGVTINAGDKVAFYFIQQRNWLAQGPGLTGKLGCLGTTLPPPFIRYDACPYETFTIEMQ